MRLMSTAVAALAVAATLGVRGAVVGAQHLLQAAGSRTPQAIQYFGNEGCHI